MTYPEACDYLYGLERRGIRLGLERIVGAMGDRGDPQESFGSLLVAGTNGKGSVCAMLASCLHAAGRRTGLFTSPHLSDFRERIRVDGRMIPEAAVVDLVEEIRESVERWHLTFFEATTLLGFLWFRRCGVELAAVEVGLGGRLDATRPVRALATLVTSIAIDHAKILGETRDRIAQEKGGIFRAGVPAVIGVAGAAAVRSLARRAEEVGAPFFERRRLLRADSLRIAAEGTRLLVSPRGPSPLELPQEELGLAMVGRHQAANALLALLALRLLPPPWEVPLDAILAGLARARWPARLERIRERPAVFCDVAHNEEGGAAVARCLREIGAKRIRLVVGMLADKDSRRFLQRMRPLAAHAHCCAPAHERALPAGDLSAIASSLGISSSAHDSPRQAYESALAESSEGMGETILVTGSFYTVGAIRDSLGIAPDDPLWPCEERSGAAV